MTQLLGVHSNIQMPYLYYLRNMKIYCNYYVLLYTAWCNVNRTVQARIQMQLIAKVPLSQKSPCSYDCCHTFIEVLSHGAGNSDTPPSVQFDRI